MTFNFGRFWQQLRQGVLGRRGAHRRARPRRFLARLLLENLEDRTVPSSVQFGLFDTGVNSSATGLADAAVDPHYTLVASADPNSPGPNAFVVNQDGFPVGNPWLADTATSKWIAPQAEQNTSTFPATAGNAGGNYDYQTTFDLGTANPSQVTLSGTLASDDTDTDILINGTSTGFTNSSASPSTLGTLTPFTISSGFVAGVNTLDFLVNNAGAGPTGLLVSSLILSEDLLIQGTGNDTLTVNATGANSGTYTFDNGTPVSFSGINSFTFDDTGTSTFTINNPSGGLFAPTGGIAYNGGGAGNTLQDLGGTSDTGTYAPNSNTPVHAGTITHTNTSLGLTQTINFTGLAPTTDTVSETTFTITDNSAGAALNIVNGTPVGMTATTEVNSNDPAFEAMDFANKTSVTVNGTGGGETISLNNPTPAAGLTNLDVEGDTTAGTITDNGGVALPAGGTLILTTGRIAQGSGTLGAGNLALSAGTGIGTSLAPLLTQVSNLVAQNGTSGGIFLSNTGALTIGYTGDPFQGVQDSGAATDSIQLTDDSTISVITGGEVVEAPGNVSLTANGTASDIVTGGNSQPVIGTTAGGTITLLAGRNLQLGGPGNSNAGDVVTLGGGASGIDLTAQAGSIFVEGGTIVGLLGGGTGGITANAPNGNIAITGTGGFLGFSTIAGGFEGGSGSVNLTAGGSFTATVGAGNSAVSSGGGAITITANTMSLQSAINAGTGIVTLQQNPGTENIDLGTNPSPGNLGLAQGDLANITASVLRIGSASNAGSITVTAPISAPSGWNTLDLLSGGTIQETTSPSSTGSLTVTNLAVQAAGGAELNGANHVVNLSGNTQVSASGPLAFSTGNPDGKIATGSQPGANEIESADDFILTAPTRLTSATFTGLLTGGATLANVSQVVVEIYGVFPFDSTNPPDGKVPTRANSPSDVELDDRDSMAGNLTFSGAELSASFTAANSVVNGINPSPNQFTGGEGPVTGIEEQFTVTFTTPFLLLPGHYFFVPQVAVTGGQFLWLSAPKPIVAPGTPFAGDLQTWIRNDALEPDWLRVGTDITHQGPFNATFSLAGQAVSAPFEFTNATSVTIGSVDGVTGISTNGGAVEVNVTAAGGGLTVANPVASSGGNISLKADGMSFLAAVNAGAGRVSLDTNDGTRPITLGGSPTLPRFAAVDDNTASLDLWTLNNATGALLTGLGTTNEQVVSTVPSNGDQNPYGLAFVPANFPTTGILQPGDALVANFNNGANTQGLGTTITRITPAGLVSSFFTSSLLGLTNALGILQAGFVIVGNVPNVSGAVGAGALQVLDRNGNLVTVPGLNGPLITDPWDLTINDQGSTAQVYVSNVSGTAGANGTVVRIDLSIIGGVITVVDEVEIGDGYPTRPDMAAFVVGPGGLAFDPVSHTLYVASQDDMVNGTEVGTIFAIANADTATTPVTEGTVVYADPVHLHGPMGLLLAPNGDLIVANSDAVNADPAQPSELVEFTPAGQFVTQFSVDPANGGAFNVALDNVATPSLFLGQADLNEVTAGTLQIGSSSDTGGITVAGAITAPSAAPGTWTTLDLENGGAVTESAGGSVQVANLAVRSGGGIALTGSNNVQNLAFDNTSGTVVFANTGALTITAVDNLTSSSGTSDVTLCAMGGNLAVNVPINVGSGATLRLSAAGTVLQNASGQLTATNLGVIAAGAVTLNNASNNVPGNVAVIDSSAGAAVQFSDTSATGFTVGTVTASSCFAGPVNGVTTSSGNVTLTTGGALMVNQPINVGSAALNATVATNVTFNNVTVTAGTATLTGTTGTGHTLTLANYTVATTWTITGSNAGNVANSSFSVAGGIGFSNFQNLTGGGENDTFLFQSGGSVASVDGGAGTNTLDYSALPLMEGTVTVTGPGATTGFMGSGFGGAFTNINVFNGLSALDGPDANNVWHILGTNSGTLTSSGVTAAFMNTPNLAGGDHSPLGPQTTDRFVFFPGGSVASVDAIFGNGILDYGNVPGPVSVTLTFLGMAQGFTGTGPGLTTGFSDIDQLIGSPSAGDILTGVNQPATWTINGTTPSQYAALSAALSFTGFEALIGGTGSDTFTVNGAGPVGLVLTGGGGGDSFLVNFGALTGSVALNDAGGSGTNTATLSAPNQANNVLVAEGDVTWNASETVAYMGLEGITVNAGGTGTVAAIQGTAGGTPTTVTANGSDTFIVGSSGNLLSGIAGPLTLQGGAGNSLLYVTEAGSTTPDTVYLTASAVISGLGTFAPISYTTAAGGTFGNGVFLVLGSGGNFLQVYSTAAGDIYGLYTGAGNDTIAVTSPTSTLNTMAGPFAIEAGSGSNLLYVSDAGDATPDSVFMGASGIEIPAIGFVATYVATGGTFGNGVFLVTGSANDSVNLFSTAAGSVNGITLGNGNNTVIISSPTQTLDTMAGPIGVQGGTGNNLLYVSEAGSSTADTLFVSGVAIRSAVSSFFVSYAVTGSGTFGRGVDVVTGSAADQVNVVGQLAGSPIGVYTGDGNDGISVYANPTSEYFLFLDGQAGANMLFVIDISGTGVIQNFPTSATSGEAEVNYPSGVPSFLYYNNLFLE